MEVIILILLIFVQLLVVSSSIRLIFSTNKSKEWLLIVSTLLFLGVGFTITVYITFASGIDFDNNLTNLLSGLCISSLLLVGIVVTQPSFRKIQIVDEDINSSRKYSPLSVDDVGIATWEYNFQTQVNQVSEQLINLLEIINLSKKENGFYPLNDWAERIHPNSLDKTMEAFNAVLERKTNNYSVEQLVYREDGSYIWLHSRGKVVSEYANGVPKVMIGTSEDITDRKNTEDKLRLSSKVFSDTKEGIIITDISGVIISVNPAFCEITGYSQGEVVGQNPRILSSGKQNAAFYEDMWQTINHKGHWQGEVWNRRKNGEEYAELLSISSILDEEGKVNHYIGIFTDITHSKKQQESLAQMAHYDLLTQLPNRTLLADRFSQALARSNRKQNILAVCFLDLDKFKPVNDRYGHEVGDKLLIEVARRLKKTIRDEDTVSRQGGDEFVLLLGDIESLSHCEQMLKRIINFVEKPYLIANQSLVIGASIGVTLYPTDNSDSDTLLRHADQAMYEAKLAGRNRYKLFNTEQDQQNIKKNIRFNEIHSALENNEMCLYYQPKVNMITGKVFGAEALLRWLDPEKGLIPPLDFLPIINETELEISVGNWVINNAFQQINTWRTQGIDIEVSVNISSYHLQSPSFIADLEKTMSLYPKVDSKNLQLEILESSALGDIKSISTITKTCVEDLGVNIALDDFGTGYSSLTHLRSLPAKTVKIDQTFVRDMLDDPNDYVIIDGVIGLANSFNRTVISEGVETTEQGLMLLAMGCNEAQGYGIARPMPAFDFQEWLASYIPNQHWLTYAVKPRTLKEKKIKLFKLTFAQWVKHFENNINAEPCTGSQWPILIRTDCHCSIWIKRARKEQVFEESWLIKLGLNHSLMHDIADDLYMKYEQGDILNARDGLNDFELAVNNLTAVLDQYE